MELPTEMFEHIWTKVLELRRTIHLRRYQILHILKITILFNPTPVQGGRFLPPYRKMAITPKNNDPTELKLFDFSYISMTNPPILFLGLKMAKKGGFRAFLLSAVPISGS